MTFARVNGVNLYYRRDGNPEGPSVVLIAGLGSDHRRWEEVVSLLPQEYSFITFDNRDSGQTERAARSYAIKDMAQDVVGLLEHLGVSEAHIVGYSMGGAIAQEIALSHPKMVRRLALVATYTSGDPRGSAIFQGFIELRRRLSREEYHRLLLPWVYTAQEYQVPGLIDEALRRVLEDPLYQEQEAYERQVRATLAFSPEGRLSRIAQPTLLIFGEDDLVTPLRFARRLGQGIPQARLVVLGGTGHGLVSTRGREVASLIAGFLSEDTP